MAELCPLYVGLGGLGCKRLPFVKIGLEIDQVGDQIKRCCHSCIWLGSVTLPRAGGF